jgi:membrane protein YqaA with SNARE-associated domain
MKPSRGIALTAVWGFAEATLFFIVPDVVVTFIALRRGFRAGWIAGAWAALAAVLGGIVIYVWAARDPATVERVLDLVPAISINQIGRAKAETGADWIMALMRGAFIGNPYKLYAAASGEQAVPLLAFLPMSFVARILRFLLAGTAARAVAVALARIGMARLQVPAWAIFWIMFYAWYLTWMPW